MERDVFDDDAADGDGLKARDGSEGTGAADLDGDTLDHRGLVGRELVGIGNSAVRRVTKPQRRCSSSWSTL